MAKLNFVLDKDATFYPGETLSILFIKAYYAMIMFNTIQGDMDVMSQVTYVLDDMSQVTYVLDDMS